jgi:hypothetical protein
VSPYVIIITETMQRRMLNQSQCMINTRHIIQIVTASSRSSLIARATESPYEGNTVNAVAAGVCPPTTSGVEPFAILQFTERATLTTFHISDSYDEERLRSHNCVLDSIS